MKDKKNKCSKDEFKDEFKDEVKDDVKDDVKDNEETDEKKCNKCKKVYNITAFKHIRSNKDTINCAKCRNICYNAYKKNDGYAKNTTFTKNKKIEYLVNVIRNEVQEKKFKKYDKLHKFGLKQLNQICIDIAI